MGKTSITFKIMPTSPSVDLAQLKSAVEKKTVELGGKFKSSTEEPIAFGIKALMCIIEYPEDRDPDALEEALAKLKDVNSVQMTDVRRVIA